MSHDTWTHTATFTVGNANTIPHSSLYVSPTKSDHLTPIRNIYVTEIIKYPCPICSGELLYEFIIKEWKNNNKWSTRVTSSDYTKIKKLIINIDKYIPRTPLTLRFMMISWLLKCRNCNFKQDMSSTSIIHDPNEPSYYRHNNNILNGDILGVSIEVEPLIGIIHPTPSHSESPVDPNVFSEIAAPQFRAWIGADGQAHIEGVQ